MEPRRTTAIMLVLALASRAAGQTTPNNCYTPVFNLDGCPPCPASQFCRRKLPGWVPW